MSDDDMSGDFVETFINSYSWINFKSVEDSHRIDFMKQVMSYLERSGTPPVDDDMELGPRFNEHDRCYYYSIGFLKYVY